MDEAKEREDVKLEVTRNVVSALMKDGKLHLAGMLARASKSKNVALLRMLEYGAIKQDLPRWMVAGIRIVTDACAE